MNRFASRRARERAAPKRPRAADRPIGQRNAKAGLAIGFPILTCRRSTVLCRQTCYACSGPIAFRDSIRKSVENAALCRRAPVRFARRVVAEFRRVARGLTVKVAKDGGAVSVKISARFVRWNSSGDLFPAARKAILAIARAGVWVHVFTRDPREGAALRRVARAENLPVLVLLSIDATSEPDCWRWRGPFAALTRADAPAPWHRLDPDRTVAFPCDGAPNAIATVPDRFRGGACPCDLGERSYVGSCAKCFEKGTGCFMFAGWTK